MADILPNKTYKIVYFLENKPAVLYSKISQDKASLVKFAEDNKISDYLINQLVEEKDNSFTWTVMSDGLGAEFVKNYNSFDAMRTKEQRMLFYGVGVGGGMLSFFIIKKFVGNSYIAALGGMMGCLLSLNAYLKIKSFNN
jgi:hypothetical protein